MSRKIEIINLPRIEDPRGSLSFIEGGAQIPFEIKRVYWIYDVPGGAFRGSHAYRELQEFIVALSGSFEVVLDDGKTESTYILNRSSSGLYVPHMVWRSLQNFSTNAVCLILASKPYSPGDYIRDHAEFKKLAEYE